MDAARLKRIQEIAGSSHAADYSRFEIVESLRYLLAEMPQWISVEERLPEMEDHCGVHKTTVVLSKVGLNVTPQVTYLDRHGYWYAYWGGLKICKQTHWMPLPAAPEGEKETK